MAEARPGDDGRHDPLRAPVRDVLAFAGDRVVPARPFHALVEVPVRAAPFVAAGGGRRRVLTAVAAVAVLVLGVVALRAVGGRETAVTSSVAPMSERSVAVPLYVPERMALREAGTSNDGGVPGAVGTAEVIAVSSWGRSDATVVVGAAAADQPVVPSGEREVVLRTGVVAQVVEHDDGMIDLAWRQPDGGPTVGIRTLGLPLAETVAIAESMWYVTRSTWADLTDRDGFASSAEADVGYDRWTPDAEIDLDESAVRIVGGLQGGLTLRFPGGLGHLVGPLTADARWCSASSMGDSTPSERRPVVLSTFDPTVTGFEVPDAEGARRRVDAEQHPGLPQMRFAVAIASSLPYGMPNVPCVRGAS